MLKLKSNKRVNTEEQKSSRRKILNFLKQNRVRKYDKDNHGQTQKEMVNKEGIESDLNDAFVKNTSYPERLESLDRTLKTNELTKHCVLGHGSFGEVLLVSDRKNEAYALKVQSKRRLLEQNLDIYVSREKSILEMVDHPFILKLFYTLQDEKYLYLITKVYLGGNFYDLMCETKPFGMIEKHGIFYAACILEGLIHMHEKNISYRDLKPENILIDSEGYCVLADLGFSKVITSKSYTHCGSPFYTAPEILLRRGHNQNADIWSLGVLIYEMIIGESPFHVHGLGRTALIERACRAKYSVEGKCSVEAADLISGMLCLNPQDRIGCLECNGVEEIRHHAWFKDIDFTQLVEKMITAPWSPVLKNQFDNEYFDVKGSSNKHCTYINDSIPLKEHEQEVFFGF